MTTTELKKPHPSRLVGGTEKWTGFAPHPRVVDKNLEGYLENEESKPHTNSPAQDQPLIMQFKCMENRKLYKFYQKVSWVLTLDILLQFDDLKNLTKIKLEKM